MKSPYTLVAAAMFFLVSSLSAQQIYYVAPVSVGNGSADSWINAGDDLYSILQTAKNNATASEVWVKAGTYTIRTGSLRPAQRELSFEIGANVQLIGGFDGTETSKLQARPSDNVTILSGEIDGDAMLNNNTYSIVLCDDCGTNSVLSGFTVTSGYANGGGNSTDDRSRAGAGIYLDGTDGKVASPTIIDVEFSDNFSQGRGGAAYFKGFNGASSPTLTRCAFLRNSCVQQGGAIYADASSGGVSNPSFDEVLISDNGTATLGGDGAGGAMYLASKTGGSALATFNKTRFINNTTVAIQSPGYSSANGGGLYIATIDPAGTNGSASATFDDCVFNGNQGYSGGAMYLNGATQVTIRNSTIINNNSVGNAGSGAGIYINNSTVTASNYISYGNTVVLNPGLGEDFRFVDGTLNISYALLAAADKTEAFSQSSINGNDAFNDGAGMIYGEDPDLIDLGGYPSPQAATSPAVGAGLNSDAQNATDLAGNVRIQSGTVDLGAIETSFAPLPVNLISFTAKSVRSQIKVAWLTAQEIDLAGYSLERSMDGEDFREVAYVPAMGTGNYAYTDLFVADGASYYYRLRSIDFDGTDYESDIVAVTIAKRGSDSLLTALYPNPTTGELTVEIPAATVSRTVYVSIYDASGRKVRMWPLTKDGLHTLDLSELLDGQYIVRLDSVGKSQSEMVTVKH